MGKLRTTRVAAMRKRSRNFGNWFKPGTGQSKAQYLAARKSKPASLTIESAVSTDVQVQIYSSTAVVTGLDTISGKNKGEPYTNRWLYMDVWVKRSGRWQCVKTYSSLANKK